MDKLTPEQRHKNMSHVRSTKTKPEQLVAAHLRSCGIGYRRYVTNLSGKPDFVLTKYHTIIFVNGCFWHGHEGCTRAELPKTNTDWWKNKIEQTKLRDERNYQVLRQDGWKIITVWECELGKNKEYRLNDLVRDILLQDDDG